MPSRIRKGDTVAVMAGREKGKRGEVAKVYPQNGTVLIHKVNMVKRHMRPSQKNPQGGIVDREAPLPLSNVMVIDPSDNKPTRISIKDVDGKRVRVSKRTGTEIANKKAAAAAS